MRILLSLLPLGLLVVAGCAASAEPRRGSDSPFAQVYAEYTVPVALGRALPGQVGGWSESVSR
jgi:hypothetical protein